jgi:hypothetical protein
MVRARVRADVSDNDDALRLVIHSYLPTQLANGQLANASERPVASAQRAVTPEELRRGVVVEMIQPELSDNVSNRPVVVAWIERGRPDLAFDARLARPRPGAPRGFAKTRGSATALSAMIQIEGS